MAAQLQAAHNMYKMQSAMANSGIDLSAVSNFDINDPLKMCTGKQEVEEDEDEDNDDQGEVMGPPDEQVKYHLRMCIHSGKGLPREMSYVRVEIQAEDGTKKTFTSDECMESNTPVWEFNIEEEIEVGHVAPNVELQIYGKRFLHDRLIGACKIPFKKTGHNWSTHGPQRKHLKTKGGSKPLAIPGQKVVAPRVLVAWQLAVQREFEPDLNRIAEMSSDALDPKKWTVDMKVCRVILKKPSRTAEKLAVKLELLSNGVPKNNLATRETPAVYTRGKPHDDQKAAKGKPTYNEAVWENDGDGWTAPAWQLGQTSKVDLLSYTIRATVRVYKDEKDSKDYRDIGVYEEGLTEIMDSIEQCGQKLWFEALVKSKTAIPVANLRCELDVYDEQPHKSQRDAIKKRKKESEKVNSGMQAPAVPQRLGMASVREGNRNIFYYCSVYADNLPFIGDKCDPYVRIIMGSGGAGRGESSHKHNQFYDVEWADTVKVACKAADRKARIEVWNDNGIGGMFHGSDELVGETEIYDVMANQTYWRHCFGGALAEPKKKDEAMQMTRGAIKPASTYHGSVAIHFGSRPKPPTGHFQKLRMQCQNVSLIVRLYRGIYLDRFKDNPEVNVLIQLPGARIEVNRDPKSNKTDNQKGVFAFNHSVLSFPGTVDQNGVLRFRPEDRPTSAHHGKPPIAWVERCTPWDPALKLLPGIAHCYCYIVPLGEEERPPAVFGRIRLQTGFDPDAPPTWKRLRYDCSVTEYNQSHFKDDLAGFLLGTAVLVRHTDELSGEMTGTNSGATDSMEVDKQNERSMAPYSLNDRMVPKGKYKEIIHEDILGKPGHIDVPKASKPASVLCRPCAGETFILVGSSGEKVRWRYEQEEKRRTVFAHVDVLAARSLQAMDEDGLCDPCYAIRIEDKMLVNQSKEFGKSLDPLFMHRVAIPVTVECDLEGDALPEDPAIPLPPIMFQMLDRDQNFYLFQQAERFSAEAGNTALSSVVGGITDFGAELTQMGKVIVKKPKVLDRDRDDPESKKADVAAPAKDEITQKKIDLNKIHQAMWHALDAPATTPFDGKKGGVIETWRTRPRVLLACGYSTSKVSFLSADEYFEKKYSEEDPWPERGYKRPLDTRNGDCYLMLLDSDDETKLKHASYQINIDLLGLRNLHEGGIKGLKNKNELLITSFWEGPQVKVDVPDTSNPNFEPEYEAEEWETFAAQVKPILKLVGDPLKKWEDDDRSAGIFNMGKAMMNVASDATMTLAVGNFGSMMGAQKKPDDDDSDSDNEQGTTLDSIMGWRLVAPEYKVPIIPYLQKQPYLHEGSSPDNGAGVGAMEKQSPLRDMDTEYVMMPDLVIQLRNAFSGADLGTFSATLPLYGNTVEDQDQDSWANVSMKSFKELVCQSVQVMKGVNGKTCLNYDEANTRLVLGETKSPLRWAVSKEKDGAKVEAGVMGNFTIQLLDDKFRGKTYLATDRLGAKVTLVSDSDEGFKKVWQIRQAGDSKYTIEMLPESSKKPMLLSASADGTVSLANQDTKSGSEHWLGKSLFRNEEFKDVKTLTNISVMEDAYEVFVDVFAQTSGFLMWNTKTRMGRCLLHQELFKIHKTFDMDDEDEEDEDEEGRESKEPPVSQHFNGADWTISDHKFAAEPFDERFTPVLRIGEIDSKGKWTNLRTKKKQGSNEDELNQWYSLPAEPKQNGKLFGNDRPFLFPSNFEVTKAGTKQDTFTSATTHAICKAARKRNYRCATHFAAPEKVSKLAEVDQFLPDDPKLEANRHVFFREVGHQIREASRNSKFLCRLKMTRPTPRVIQNIMAKDEKYWDDEEKKLMENYVKSQKELNNYLVIKFTRPGTVVWAAPKELFEFDKPGEILFAVKLNEADVIVPVYTPVFDLRFHRETSWYVRKTCVQRFKNLENRINLKKAAEMKKRKQLPASDGVPQPPPDAAEAAEAGAAGASDADPEGAKHEAQGKAHAKKEKVDADDDDPTLPPAGFETDGYSLPLFVQKNAFCLRIRKGDGTHNFDRPRSRNWYRAVLSDVFPEVENLPIDHTDDFANVRKFFFSRFMNLRTSLVSGEAMDEQGLIKGHVSMHKLTEAELYQRKAKKEEEERKKQEKKDKGAGKLYDAAEKQIEETQRLLKSGIGAFNKWTGMHIPQMGTVDPERLPKTGLRPIENLWIRSDVLVNVYVLTARNMKADHGLKEMRPYVVCELVGASNRQDSPPIEDMEPGATKIDFYKHFSFQPVLPGPSTLRIQIFNKKNVVAEAFSGGEQLLGTVEVDLEDRNFVLAQRKLRARSNESFLKLRRSPDKKRSVEKMKDLEEAQIQLPENMRRPLLCSPTPVKDVEKDHESQGIRIHSQIAPFENLPIENKIILCEDEETGTQEHVGNLRFWVDICGVDDAYTTAKLDNPVMLFEVRVTIWGITGISIFQDMGERNDVYVRGKMRSCGPNGVESDLVHETDCHKWAHKEANFNWMMVWKIRAPAQFCTIEFTMMDMDKISESDPIYDPKELPLDHHLMLAFSNAVEGKDPLGTDSTAIVFDAWPKKHKKKDKEDERSKKKSGGGCCGCCCRRRAPTQPGAATMKISVQVVPADGSCGEAKTGRIGTEEPKGRMSWKSIIQEPVKFIKILLGPTNYGRLKCGAIIGVIILICLVILVLIYLFLQNAVIFIR